MKEQAYRQIIQSHVNMKKEYKGYELDGKIAELVAMEPGDKELIEWIAGEIQSNIAAVNVQREG